MALSTFSVQRTAVGGRVSSPCCALIFIQGGARSGPPRQQPSAEMTHHQVLTDSEKAQVFRPKSAARVLLIQVGTPPLEIRDSQGDLPIWFSQALGKPVADLDVVRVFEDEQLPPPDPNKVAIITGSWEMVTDRHGWSELTAEWIRQAVAIRMPLFGVCYGHQLMAHALGGRVDFHPEGREMGCLDIVKTAAGEADPFLMNWPHRFQAHLTHLQTVMELPPGATTLAVSRHDRHQVVRYGPNAISTQFHPEFTPAISAACIQKRRQALHEEGRDPDAMLSALKDTPEAMGMLRAFVASAAGESAHQEPSSTTFCDTIG